MHFANKSNLLQLLSVNLYSGTLYVHIAFFASPVDLVGPCDTQSGREDLNRWRVAIRKFQSSFGGSGSAEVVLSNGVLVWTLLPEVKGENWLPPKAKLRAAAASKWGNSLKKCSGSFTQVGPQ